jgi:hypothetical protein
MCGMAEIQRAVEQLLDPLEGLSSLELSTQLTARHNWQKYITTAKLYAKWSGVQ